MYIENAFVAEQSGVYSRPEEVSTPIGDRSGNFMCGVDVQEEQQQTRDQQIRDEQARAAGD